MLLDYPGGLVMVVFYNVFLLLFMFVVITRLVAGHWIVPFALIIKVFLLIEVSSLCEDKCNHVRSSNHSIDWERDQIPYGWFVTDQQGMFAFHLGRVD